MSNSLSDVLANFLAQNPDLPTGVDTTCESQDPEPGNKAQTLEIILERKGRAGKSATIVSGFTIPHEEVTAIASKLKSRLGTGGSARGGEILIQGDRRQEMATWLREQGHKVKGVK